MKEALVLYRSVLDSLISGREVDKNNIARTNLALACALDQAKVNNQSTEDLEFARDAVLHLSEVL